jgi:hypothetical protein
MLPVLAVAALILVATGKRKGASGPAAETLPERITFKQVDRSNPAEWESQFCWSGEWAGNRDSTKEKDTAVMYVKFWGVPPPRAFLDAIAVRDPCNADEAFNLVKKWPPFPGETMTVDEFKKRIRERQIVFEAELAEAEADRKTAEAIVTGLIEIGAVALSVATAGAGTPVAVAVGTGLSVGTTGSKVVLGLGRELYR